MSPTLTLQYIAFLKINGSYCGYISYVVIAMFLYEKVKFGSVWPYGSDFKQPGLLWNRSDRTKQQKAFWNSLQLSQTLKNRKYIHYTKEKEKHILHASTQTHINTQLACHYLNSLHTENKMEMSKILSYLLSSPSEKQVARCWDIATRWTGGGGA